MSGCSQVIVPPKKLDFSHPLYVDTRDYDFAVMYVPVTLNYPPGHSSLVILLTGSRFRTSSRLNYNCAFLKHSPRTGIEPVYDESWCMTLATAWPRGAVNNIGRIDDVAFLVALRS